MSVSRKLRCVCMCVCVCVWRGASQRPMSASWHPAEVAPFLPRAAKQAAVSHSDRKCLCGQERNPEDSRHWKVSLRMFLGFRKDDAYWTSRQSRYFRIEKVRSRKWERVWEWNLQWNTEAVMNRRWTSGGLSQRRCKK